MNRRSLPAYIANRRRPIDLARGGIDYPNRVRPGSGRPHITRNRMKNITSTFLLLAMPAALIAAGCSSTPSNLQTTAGDTRPQPVVVQVPVQVSTPALESGCWVQFYGERNFKGDVATLVGPVALDSPDKMTGRQLKSHIDSLVTGSKATLRVYEHSMFKDRSTAFGPNSREGGLITKLGIGGDIQSLQLECDG